MASGALYLSQSFFGGFTFKETVAGLRTDFVLIFLLLSVHYSLCVHYFF